jgi:hypothetical protein
MRRQGGIFLVVSNFPVRNQPLTVIGDAVQALQVTFDSSVQPLSHSLALVGFLQQFFVSRIAYK